MTTALTTALQRPAGTAHPGWTPAGLLRRARRVLHDNWTGSSTVPSRALYPHQWSWDSAFIAIGLRHFAPERARRELTTLFAAQWADGRVPHIVFNPAVPLDAYFPSPDFWRSATDGAAAGAPATVQTSGLVQPPVHALAAWLTHLADPAGSGRTGFLAGLYPKLTAWQRYLTGPRDLGGRGLAAIVHPWESGMDNSPCWDAPLARVAPAPPGSFRRCDLDHGDPGDRPTDLDYRRYVALARTYRDHGYHDARTPHSFAVEDPGFNALLILAEHALAEIAQALGADPTDHRIHAEELTNALVKRCWDGRTGLFLCHDLIAGRTLPARSATGLLPLVVPGLPGHIADALLRTMEGEHFSLGHGTRLVPSYDLCGKAFDASRYWRGPAWFNVNWLIERGLREQGRPARAAGLRSAILGAAADSGFAEYLDPYTEQPHGARNFSWTAALAADLLETEVRHLGTDAGLSQAAQPAADEPAAPAQPCTAGTVAGTTSATDTPALTADGTGTRAAASGTAPTAEPLP
ncbi:amylo-alpha-1,6-glucosidase [Streptomyces aidingensis]|uniref:Mannosylglycerate hydrolase MGH1-like glycoside hydrolase domain-containing protein n=1 Tax=Streptomyces aidingensis TaxID=910347 RepID=A0A1I1FPY5_9ACTN|nr:hypothetical protein [Streptomyces aidingensis]SFC01405.1 hypothetical protein SAMN05421773_101824 [Streptomyces aidingensis]